jgi:hypothetical protein
MRLKAHLLGKAFFTAGTEMVMTGFRFQDTHVAFCFGFKAFETVTLRIGLWRGIATRNAENSTSPFELELFSKTLHQIGIELIQNKLILDMARKCGV